MDKDDRRREVKKQLLRKQVLRFLGLSLVVVLGVAGTVRAAETGTEEQPGQEIQLTLAQAVGMALEREYQIALAALDVAKAGLQTTGQDGLIKALDLV